MQSLCALLSPAHSPNTGLFSCYSCERVMPHCKGLIGASGSLEPAQSAVTRRQVAASVLGVAPALEQPLMEAGLDSLGAVELRNGLATLFAVELPATVTFDHPTAAALGSFIAGAPHSKLLIVVPVVLHLSALMSLHLHTLGRRNATRQLQAFVLFAGIIGPSEAPSSSPDDADSDDWQLVSRQRSPGRRARARPAGPKLITPMVCFRPDAAPMLASQTPILAHRSANLFVAHTSRLCNGLLLCCCRQM